MLIVMILSLHVLLVLLYAIAIEKKLSRHSYIHLLFAALVPLVGELCLFASEFGRADTVFPSEKLFHREISSGRTRYCGEVSFELPVTRETLLDVIETQPDNLVAILKCGVESDDIEVAHISAATIMKLQREYEKRISSLRDEYLQLPDNMELLKKYIVVVGEYYASGLLEGEAAAELLLLQESLLIILLRVLPKDEEAEQMLADNRENQRKETALNEDDTKDKKTE